MNWINLKDLENRLVDNNVSEKEGFHYLLANIVLFSLVIYISDESYSHGALLFVEIIIMLAITVFAVNKTFNVNQNGDGNDYFKRFLSLYFVIGIRLILFVLAVGVIATILAFIFGIFSGISEHVHSNGANGVSGSNGEVARTYFGDFMSIGIYAMILVVFYYLLIRSFKRVAHA